MAEVVLVHGIGQERESADSLESSWLPSLAGGVRTAGAAELADRLWRESRPGGLTSRMAFYGDLFGVADPQGDEELTERQRELAAPLATEWLARLADRGTKAGDRMLAERELAGIERPGEPQGVRAALRPALNALVRLRPFATLGAGVAERFVLRALRQVTTYLTDEAVREAAQARVAELIGPETRVLIGHSLGSVVAYEAAHRLTGPLPLLVTIGSPLGLRSVVYERLRPQPPRVPDALGRWVNLVDRDDLVAAEPDLTVGFPGAHGVLESAWTLDNGAHPHEASFYLTAVQTGRAVAAALNNS